MVGIWPERKVSMDFVGLLRQMHTVLDAVGIFFILTTIAFVLVGHYFKNEMVEGVLVKAIAGKVYLAVVLILLAVILIRGLSIASSNRIPRSTEDKTDVYRQAEENKTN